jgi:hypothetical protein
MKSQWNDEELHEILVRWTWGRQAFKQRPTPTSVESALHEYGPEVRRVVAQKSDEFWDQQRQAIRCAILPQAQPRTWRPTTLAWAGVSVLLMLGIFMLNLAPRPEPMGQRTPSPIVDPDHLLLMQVERSIELPGPAALEPAALLADEINRGMESDFDNQQSMEQSK